VTPPSDTRAIGGGTPRVPDAAPPRDAPQPTSSPLTDIPIVRDDEAFVAGDAHWRAALAEYHAATDDEARYVALLLANALLDAQLLRIHAIHARIGARRFDDPEREAALTWAQSWSTSVDSARLDEWDLLSRLGRARADTLADEQVKPRLASLNRHDV
jgi:hypothetical protein